MSQPPKKGNDVTRFSRVRSQADGCSQPFITGDILIHKLISPLYFRIKVKKIQDIHITWIVTLANPPHG